MPLAAPRLPVACKRECRGQDSHEPVRDALGDEPIPCETLDPGAVRCFARCLLRAVHRLVDIYAHAEPSTPKRLEPNGAVRTRGSGLAGAAEHEAADREPEPEGTERERADGDRLSPEREAPPAADRFFLLVRELPTPLLPSRPTGPKPR